MSLSCGLEKILNVKVSWKHSRKIATLLQLARFSCVSLFFMLSGFATSPATSLQASPLCAQPQAPNAIEAFMLGPLSSADRIDPEDIDVDYCHYLACTSFISNSSSPLCFRHDQSAIDRPTDKETLVRDYPISPFRPPRT